MTGKLKPTANKAPAPTSTSSSAGAGKGKKKAAAQPKKETTGSASGEGEVYRHHSISIAHFSQHHAEQFDLSMTPLQFLNQTFPGLPEQTCMPLFSLTLVSSPLFFTSFRFSFSIYLHYCFFLSSFCFLFCSARKIGFLWLGRKACLAANIIPLWWPGILFSSISSFTPILFTLKTEITTFFNYSDLEWWLCPLLFLNFIYSNLC
jgi:hypothetical protein